MNQRHKFGELQTPLEKAVSLISTFMDMDNVVLGGGTVLAYRWDHRYSTDLDFFTNQDIRSGMPFYSTMLGEQEENGKIENLALIQDAIFFEIDGTPVSLFEPARRMTKNEPNQKVEELGLWLDTSAEILANKIAGRMLNKTQFNQRDLYDICVAKIQDDASLNEALTVTSTPILSFPIDELRDKLNTPNFGLDDRYKSLIDPKYTDIAENLADCAMSVLSGETHDILKRHINPLPDRK